MACYPETDKFKESGEYRMRSGYRVIAGKL